MERRRRGEERRRDGRDRTSWEGRGIIIITHYPGIKKRDSDRHPVHDGTRKKKREKATWD